MANAYTVDDLLEFLDHAGDKGLMPAATAQALAVASRNVMGILSEQEKKDLSQLDVDSVIKRFNNKRARDFNPSSLKEYGRRVRKAVELFLSWREDPSSFSVKTRAKSGPLRKDRSHETAETPDSDQGPADGVGVSHPGTYNSSIPVRPGVVVTLSNVPHDLSKAEAERLAAFVKMLAIGT